MGFKIATAFFLGFCVVAASLRSQTKLQGQGAAQPSGAAQATESELVTLIVTVNDAKGNLVTDLSANDFVVYEDDKPQPIVSFSREDLPVSIGIVVDNSGSMREKRASVTKAVMNLLEAGSPKNEVLVVNFSDDAYLDQDFTTDVNLARQALDRLDARGGTALYDAVFDTIDHMIRKAKTDQRFLLVIADGADNESVRSLEEVIRAAQDERGPTVYTIGILGGDLEGKERRARRALDALALSTGGTSFFPKTLNELDGICQTVAREIHNHYRITYKSANSVAGSHNQIKVVAHSPRRQGLVVRAKPGYFVSQKGISR